ncbi:MAG: CpXC domain-containing protein [Elusimicrobiota bacterium]|jgi:hypothetical protein|nr:CpXC domain-containing protein [Elusimicrobiota bacterium]
MKSIKGQGQANCPNGCEPFDAEFWTLIRGDQDTELKAALLGGELNLLRCPECETFFYHDRNFIYFDPSIELLALVSPKADKKDFDKIKTQMQKDFKLLKDNMTSLSIDYDPFYLAGLEELKAMLEYEEHITQESEVIAAYAAEKGYKIAALKRYGARLKGYPFYIPVDGGDYNAASVLSAAREILKINPSWHLLTALEKDLKAGKPLPEKI